MSTFDVAGRRRSPATFPEFHAGRVPGNKGMRYPADPPRVEEIVAVMRAAGSGLSGARIRGLIVVLWRAGLRIQEALDLHEQDLDARAGALLVRCGKGGSRREVGMDDWGWEHLSSWLAMRLELPIGPLFCTIEGATRGRPWQQTGVRSQMRRLATQARVRRRFAPHHYADVQIMPMSVAGAAAGGRCDLVVRHNSGGSIEGSPSATAPICTTVAGSNGARTGPRGCQAPRYSPATLS